MYIFQQKLKTIKEEIKKWNMETFGNIIIDKRSFEHKMELQQKIINEGIIDQRKQEEIKLQQSWVERVLEEEKLWHKKSRINWLKCWKRNFAFFHRTMIQHIRNNIILALKNKEGNLIHSHEKMEEKLNQYFNTLFMKPRNDHARNIQKTMKQ